MIGRLLQQQNFQTRSFAAVGLVAVLVYANTLIGDFTFDDNFALITNGDVTNPAIPTKDLFKHDFWGQDITSTQSHKSYRPFTILAFRLTHRAWRLVTAVAPGFTQLLPTPASILPGQDVDSSKAERPLGLHPFPFHLLCVLMHALASMLVLALCQHLFAVLEGSSTAATQVALEHPPAMHSTRPTQEPSKCTNNMWQQLLMWQAQPQLWQLPCSTSYRAQALLAGLMFALHPVHTEAVAGIVGCAELLCAALSCPALLLYFMAADGRYAAAQRISQQGAISCSIQATVAGASQSSNQHGAVSAAKPGIASVPHTAVGTSHEPGAAAEQPLWLLADALQHWLLVLAAAVLAFSAALSKEIGITVVGTMLLYDLVLATHIRQLSVQANSSSSSGTLVQQQRACRRMLLRMVFIAATALVYVKLRQWVAVQQLVQIYRKVENPIPFANSRLTRALSTGYLHARYFWLLVMPLHLSADWSFSCIPLVEHWADVRNLGTLALYCYYLYTALSAKPLSLLLDLWQAARLAVTPPSAALTMSHGSHGTTAAQPAASNKIAGGPAVASSTAAAHPALDASCARSRWRLMVLVGLVVAPFFPASNVLFYVGTFIGERLLYSPSIGYCLLAADVLGGFMQYGSQRDPAQQEAQQDQRQQGQDDEVTASQVRQRSTAAAAAKPSTKQQRQQQQQPPTMATSEKQHGPSTAGLQGAHSSRPYTGGMSVRSWSVLLLCVLLLGGYAGRTLLRNQDWWDDERLFLAALRVCPNSAKVQQNCGVLQRRYKNYTAAMEHFRRAQEIEPGYCEPSYWMGLTTLNKGDPVAGLAAIKASLSCKYTASEALAALNKVYLLMMGADKDHNPTPLIDWSDVLASPHVLRVADACATAEEAAMVAALTGRGVDLVNRAVGVCHKGLHEWQHGEPQHDTIAALTKQRLASMNATLLSACVDMRQKVYKKMASHGVESKTVRRAVYRYIMRVTKQYPGCRTLAGGGPLSVEPEGPPEGGVGPSTHQKLLHKVQAADPEDPWLQAEWGATLLALGPTAHLQEASRHLEVAAAIFTKASQELMAQTAPAHGRPAEQRGAGGASGPHQPDSSKLLGLTQLDGKTPLTPLTALQAAVQALDGLQAVAGGSKDQVVVERVCDGLQQACYIKLHMVALMQQQQEQGLVDRSQKEALQAAKGAGRQCLAELSQQPGCAVQAASLRKMVRFAK